MVFKWSINDLRQILRKQWDSRYCKLPCETGKLAL